MRKINFIALIITLSLVSCKSEEEQIADETYDRFTFEITKDSLSVLAKDEAEYLASNHYDPKIRHEAESWLEKYKVREKTWEQENKKEKDSIDHRLSKIGKYFLIQYEEQQKCNLFVGSYLYENRNVDSSDLAFLAKYLADYLYDSNKSKPDCEYPKMSSARIYLSTSDYKDYEGNYVAICNITPENYTGDVFVQTYKLKNAKSEKRK